MSTSRRFVTALRVSLSIVIMLFTIGVLARPQGSLQAATYHLSSCNVSELITVYSTAIVTTSADYIYLKQGCTYTFTSANASGRALPDLPDMLIAGSIYVYGNGSTITRTRNSFGFLKTLSDSSLDVFDTYLTNFSSEVGGVFDINGGLSLYRCWLSSNTSTYFGGAVFGGGGSSLNINNTGFYFNATRGNGGAISAYGGLVIRASTFFSNVAGSHGGALHLFSRNSSISDTTFGSNRANIDGGGLQLSSGVYRFANLTLYDNRADDDANGTGEGGGISVTGALITPIQMYITS